MAFDIEVAKRALQAGEAVDKAAIKVADNVPAVPSAELPKPSGQTVTASNSYKGRG